MKVEAARRLDKAARFLAQAEECAPETSPGAVIHLSYYSMLHAAAAVLVERLGRAPKTHRAVIAQFSNPIRNEGDRARSLSVF